MKKIKITENQALMLKNLDKPKKIRVTESQYKRLVEMSEPNKNVDLYTFGNEVKEFLKGLLTDHKTAGISPFWETAGTTRLDVFNAMKELGLVTIINDGGKNQVRVVNNGIKRKIKSIYEKLIGDTIDEADAPYDDTTKYSQRKPIKGLFTLTYYNDEFAILNAPKGAYFFYYKNIDKNDFLDYAETEMLGKDSFGETTIDGEAIQGYVNNNYKSMSVGDGINSYEAGDDLVKIDNEVKHDILNTWGSNDKINKALSVVTEGAIEETTVAGASADGGSSGPFVGNKFFARSKSTAPAFKKQQYNGGKIVGTPIDGNAGDLTKNMK